MYSLLDLVLARFSSTDFQASPAFFDCCGATERPSVSSVASNVALSPVGPILCAVRSSGCRFPDPSTLLTFRDHLSWGQTFNLSDSGTGHDAIPFGSQVRSGLVRRILKRSEEYGHHPTPTFSVISSGVLPPQARTYHRAFDLPEQVRRALLQNEAAANVILPFAKKALNSPREDDNEQLWIALYDDTNSVEFVLSCNKGPLGNYPIFIVACKSSAQLAKEERRGMNIADSLLPLVLGLLEKVPPQRVFSVFSIAKVTKTFAEIFEAYTRQEHGIQALKDPYYNGTFTFCTSETFNESLDLSFPLRESDDIVVALCRADMSHLNGVKAMCKAFSETSWPYILDDAGAELEAKTMITDQQVWVHMVQKASQEPEIACLVATTRESDHVTAVTKVFTAVDWRSRGCAARLLHRVCQDVLQKKKRVVLYVGNSEELVSARNVYHKIGFQGLNGSQGQQMTDVERWVEIGFKGTNLGYW